MASPAGKSPFSPINLLNQAGAKLGSAKTEASLKVHGLSKAAGEKLMPVIIEANEVSGKIITKFGEMLKAAYKPFNGKSKPPNDLKFQSNPLEVPKPTIPKEKNRESEWATNALFDEAPISIGEPAKKTTATNQEAPQAAGLKRVELPQEVKTAFSNVRSKDVVKTTSKGRDDYRRAATKNNARQPVVLSKSEFVPDSMVEHLMRDKKDSAIQVKRAPNDTPKNITNAEGAMHTFLTPVTPIEILGDHIFENGRHGLNNLGAGKARQVILSAAIHPDFEMSGSSEVVMGLVEAKSTEVQGRELPRDFKPLSKQVGDDTAQFQEKLESYDRSLMEHMVHHLTSDHKIPAKSEIPPENIFKSPSDAIAALENLITSKGGNIEAELKGKFVELNGHTISLESLFNIYVRQIRNEFSVLEASLTKGYVYTMDPPSIFAAQIGKENVPVLNRLQILAMKHIQANTPFKNMKAVAFNDYADRPNDKSPGAVALLKNVFPDKIVDSKSAIFPKGRYNIKGDKGWAVVIKNNSDAFGQNLETEGPTSMDGVIGTYSNASVNLDRQNPDLLRNVI